MKKEKRNFIYAYDEDTRKIIVIDAETGERIEQKNDRVLSILRYLKEQNEDVKLRKFAMWCAQQSNNQIKPMQKKFLELAERAIENKAERDDLQQIYNESEGEAIATDTVELRQGSMKAPGFLASRECINPDAFEGAKNAARFHCLWAEVENQEEQDEDKTKDFLDEIGQAASPETIDSTEQKQIDYLLDLIGG